MSTKVFVTDEMMAAAMSSLQESASLEFDRHFSYPRHVVWDILKAMEIKHVDQG